MPIGQCDLAMVASFPVRKIADMQDCFTSLLTWRTAGVQGPLWGDSGYIKLVRNLEGVPFGQCGVAMVASFPIKKTDNPPIPSPTPPEPPTPPKPEPVACDATGTASCPAGTLLSRELAHIVIHAHELLCLTPLHHTCSMRLSPRTHPSLPPLLADAT